MPELNHENLILSRINNRLSLYPEDYKKDMIQTQISGFNIKVYTKIYYCLKLI